MNKRTFLQHSLALGVAALIPRVAVSEWLEEHKLHSAETLARDEKFWAGIRAGYKLKPDYINLENGYYCFLPQKRWITILNTLRR